MATGPAPGELPQPAPAEERKSLFEKVMTSTPVVMTVIATILAGMSSSQMTQAQYHRSIAAQNQSKAGNQWDFFQAKRIRGTTLLMTIQQLRSLADISDTGLDGIRAAFVEARLGLERDAGEVKGLLGPLPGDGPGAGTALAARDLATKLGAARAEVQRLRDAFEELLGSDKQEALRQFAFLTSRGLPLAPEEMTQGKPARVSDLVESDILAINPQISKAASGVRERVGSAEMKELMTPKQTLLGVFHVPGPGEVKPAQLQEAIDRVQERGRAFEKLTDPVVDLGRAVNQLLARLLAVVRGADRAVTAFVAGLPSAPDKEGTLRERAKAIQARTEAIRDRALAAANSFIVATLDFDVRRYDREARYTEETARLYELQVRRSEFNSDAYQARSQFIFFGMLAAQAGVTIATLSLAVKQRNLLWTLASFAGLAAILIGVYVFLFVN